MRHSSRRLGDALWADNGYSKHATEALEELSYPAEVFSGMIRFTTCPFVFVQRRSGTRWKNPEKVFKEGCRLAQLEWAGFHDLRRFRACQWLMHGVDIETVRDLLGHASIQTTQRYLRGISLSRQTVQAIREAQQREVAELIEAAN